MFETNIEKIAFQTTLTQFTDELLQKQIQVTNIQLDFVKQFQGLINSPNHHAEMVKYSTKIIGQLDKILKDMQYHFYQLKLGYAYSVFEKIFKISIFGYKILSQAFLMRYQDEKAMKKLGIENNHSHNEGLTESKFQNFKKQEVRENYKKMEYFNFVIQQFERRDRQIEKQLSQYLMTVKLEKELVKKIMPSNTVQKIIQIQGDFNDLINRSEEMFESVFRFRHDDLKKSFQQLQKPSQIQNFLDEQISARLKYGFFLGIQKVMEYFEEKFQARTNKFFHKQKSKRTSFIEQSFQTEFQIKNGQSKEVISEITDLKAEMDQLKKSLIESEKENQKLKNNLKKTQKQLTVALQDSQIIETMVHTKEIENQKHRMELEWSLKKKQNNIERLSQQVQKLKAEQEGFKLRINQEKKENCEVQTDFYEDECQSSLVLKSGNRKKSFKKPDSKNLGMRNSLIYIIQKMNQLLEIPVESEQMEKDFKKFSTLEELKDLVNEWAEEIKKMRKECCEKQPQMMSTFPNNLMKKRRSILVSRKSSKDQLRFLPNSQSVNVSTQTIPHDPNLNNEEKKGLINIKKELNNIEKKKETKKVKIPEISNMNKRKSIRSKENLINNSLSIEERMKTEREEKKKKKSNLNQIFKTATFEQLNLNNKISSKVRKSKVGLYLSSFSNRKYPQSRKNVVIQPIDEI